MSDSPSSAQDELLESMLGDFLDESDQLLLQLNEKLLQLDQWARTEKDSRESCDIGLLNETFRAAHSLKGLSAMLGLTDINNLTHKIENVLDAARKDELTVTGDVTQLVLMGLDQLDALIERLKDPAREPVDCTAISNSIREMLQAAGAERCASTQADAEKALAAGMAAQNDATPGASPPRSSQPGPSRESDPLKGVQDESEIPDKYLSIFIDEAEESLDDLTASLLALERGRGLDRLNRVLGTAHKIKGSAAAIGLNRIAKLSHLMEDILENLGESSGMPSPEIVDVLLKGSDALQRCVAALKQGDPIPGDLSQTARELLAAHSRDFATPIHATMTYKGLVEFESELPNVGLKARLLYEKLAKLGDVLHCQPEPDSLEDLEELESLSFRLVTERPRSVILDRLRIAGVIRREVAPVGDESDQGDQTLSPIAQDSGNSCPAQPPAGQSAATPQAARSSADEDSRGSDAGPRPTETLRVEVSRLDKMMDLAGQLILNRAQFTQIGDRLQTVLACKQSIQAINRVSAELNRMNGEIGVRIDDPHAGRLLESVRTQVRRIQNDLEPVRRELQKFSQARDYVRDLFEAIHQFGLVSDAVQQCVMDTRMVPIGPLFARFKRVVRDITRSTGRQAKLEIRGENTELDKRMVDELGDPLVHLVRNAVDHGIESPEARQAAGKPSEGTVTLVAFHRGNNVVIEVSDDGKGLDAERIVRKCLEKGLLTKAEADKMTPQQIYQKIWEPGLSTAEKVTDVSGRGMGMDIVKAKVEELRGTAEIISVPGQGTTVTIKLPLTMAILPSLMVEIGGGVFAIPLEAVAEIVRIGRDCTSTVQGRPVATLRGRAVSMARLTDLLSFDRPDDAAASRPDETTLVIVGEGKNELGLEVDRVLGEGDVVIKSIAENYRNVPGIAGATILGDGRVALILDIASLIDIISKNVACSNR